nr:SMP-30/gluconolactonase/LRE family protein [Hyphomonas sp. Mor2]
MTNPIGFTQPYPGIRPFKKSEWPIFFGRNRMIDAVMERLASAQFVLLHGTSGCGKSSLVKAGLLPRLEMSHHGHEVGWHTAQMRPGAAPLWNLAEAIARLIEGLGDEDVPSMRLVRDVRRRLNRGIDAIQALVDDFELGKKGNVCLLIDQFEEIFRYAAEIERSEVEMLIEVLRIFADSPPDGIHVIATMRSDFLGDCAKFVGFAEVVNKTQYLLPRLEQAELMESIIGPAEVFGGEVETELALRLIDESRDEVDALPLVQHCLMYLWNKASEASPDRVQLRLDGYLGLKQTLSQRADEVLHEIEEKAQGGTWCAEHLFRAIIDLDGNGRATRRPIRRSVIEAICQSHQSALETTIDHFCDAHTGFLLQSDDEDPVVDITHESLIRCWDRLNVMDEFDADDRPRGWLQREHDDARMWRALMMRAEEGESLRDEAAIVEREKLVRTLPGQAWTERYGGHWDEVNALLATSRAEIDERKEKERKNAERKQLLVIGAFAVLGIGIITIGSLWSSANNSRDRVQDVLWGNLISRWERVVQPTAWEADGVTNDVIDSTDVRAQVGLYILDTGQIDVDNTDGLDEELQISLEDKLRDFRVASVALRPVFETQFAIYNGSPQEVDGVAVSSDGRYVAAGEDAGHIVIWDAAAGYEQGQIKELRRFLAHGNQVGQVRFRPGAGNGYELLSVGYDGKAKVWNALTGDLIREFEAPGRNWGGSWSQDGSKLAAGADRGTARVFDYTDETRTAPLFEVDSRSELAMGVAFNPDANQLAVAPVKEGIQLYDISAPPSQSSAPALAPPRIGEVGEGELFSVEWSLDGKYIASGLDNGDMLVWNADGERNEVARMNNVQAARALAFGKDNAYLATGSDAGEARVWSLPDGKLVAELRGHTDDVDSIAWTPGGDYIVTGTDDGFLRIFRFEEPDFSQPISEVIEQTRARFASASSEDGSSDEPNVCLSTEQWRSLVGASIAPYWCRTSEQAIADTIASMGTLEDFSEAQTLLRELVPQTSAHAVFERLMDAMSLSQLQLSGRKNKTERADRYLNLGRSLVSEQHPERASRLAFLRMMTQTSEQSDPATQALLAMESLSYQAWASGTEIFDRADVASLFANRPEPFQSFLPDVIDAESSHGQIRALSTDAMYANLAVASNDGGIFLWDLATRSVEPLLQTDDRTVVYDVAVNPAGTLVAAALSDSLEDGRFALYDLENGRIESQIGDKIRDPRSIGWSADGQVLATGADAEIAQIWRMQGSQVSDEAPVILEGHSGGIRSIALSRNGQFVVTGATDATARVWDSRTGSSLHVIKQNGSIDSVDYSAAIDEEGSSLLAIGGAGNVVELWRILADGNVSDMEHSLVFASNVEDVAFSNDGKYLAVASSSVSIWESETGKRRLTLDIEDITALTWAADGTALLTGSRTGEVHKFTFDPETLAARAGEFQGQCLDAEQRQQFELSSQSPAWCSGGAG